MTLSCYRVIRPDCTKEQKYYYIQVRKHLTIKQFKTFTNIFTMMKIALKLNTQIKRLFIPGMKQKTSTRKNPLTRQQC